jgi:hypothetical protein
VADGERMLIDWHEKITGERERKVEEYITAIYNQVDALRVRLNGGQPTIAKAREGVDGLAETVDELRITMAAHEGARQVLLKMRQQDGGLT